MSAAVALSCVAPEDVAALRAELAPAFAALEHDRPNDAEAVELARAWRGYVARPVTWLSAPDELEAGRDLEARLLVIVGPRPMPTRTGKILNQWTVGELADLVKAEQYQLGELDAAKGCPAWAAADPQGYGKWAADVYDATDAMNKALWWANLEITTTPGFLMDITPSLQWDSVIAAAHPFGDLARRFSTAGYCPWPDMGGMPQPTAPDVDLGAYKWADVAAKGIEAGAKAVASAAKSATPWIIAGVAAAGVLIFALKK